MLTRLLQYDGRLMRLTVADEATDYPNLPNAWFGNVGFDASGTSLYVPSGSDTLNVLDIMSTEFVAQLAMAPPLIEDGLGYSYGIVVDPATGRMYIANSASNALSVEDTVERKYLHAVSVGYFPNGLVFAPLVNEIFQAGFE